MDQSTGETYCLERGGHLAAYTSAVEQNEVEQFYVKNVSPSQQSTDIDCSCNTARSATAAVIGLGSTPPLLNGESPCFQLAPAAQPLVMPAAVRQPAGQPLVHSLMAIPATPPPAGLLPAHLPQALLAGPAS